MSIKRFIPLFLLLLFLGFPLESRAVDTTVRVGFIPDGNFYAMDEIGNMSGYNYDYLQKVAQYTGWDLEFILIEGDSLDSAYETSRIMLENEEIDLLGSHSMTPENQNLYEFGTKHYATVRSTLCAMANNTSITRNNYFTQENLNAALITDHDFHNQYFYSIMDKYGISTDVTYVDSQAEAVELLKTEQVDVIMSTDFSVLHDSLLILESDQPIPLYFIAKKGNTTLIDELDFGINCVEVANNYSLSALQEKYFGTGHIGNILLTEQETEVLKDYPYLKVGLIKNQEPYQFYEDSVTTKTPSGISTETLEQISQIIGLPFRYVWADSPEEIAEKIQNQEIDIFATLPTDYTKVKNFNVTLTDPYLSNGAVILYQNGESEDFSQAYFSFVSDDIPYFNEDSIQFIENTESAILEMSQRNDVILFCDPFMAQYYLQIHNISNLELQSLSNVSSEISMGVGKHIDPIIVGLLNHAILHLDSNTVDEIVLRNLIIHDGISVNAFLKENMVTIFIIITISLLGILFTVLYHARKFRNMSRQDSLTKLYNAGFFHKYAAERAKKIEKGALILVDIDYFKKVNDIHGHKAGDEVIKTVADTLKKNFRDGDTVARLGGDEFVIFLEEMSTIHDLEERSQKILKDLAEKSSTIPVTLSIGGYLFMEKTTYDDLYALADEVLYQVKEKGRNGYDFQVKRQAKDTVST